MFSRIFTNAAIRAVTSAAQNPMATTVLVVDAEFTTRPITRIAAASRNRFVEVFVFMAVSLRFDCRDDTDNEGREQRQNPAVNSEHTGQ